MDVIKYENALSYLDHLERRAKLGTAPAAHFETVLSPKEARELIMAARFMVPNWRPFDEPVYEVVMDPGHGGRSISVAFQRTMHSADHDSLGLLFDDAIAEIFFRLPIGMVSDAIEAVSKATGKTISTVPILCDDMEVADEEQSAHPNAIYQTAPAVCVTPGMTWHEYLESLPRKRRYKVKEARKQFVERNYHTEVLHYPTPEVVMWINDMLRSTWAEDVPCTHEDYDNVWEVAVLQWLLAYVRLNNQSRSGQSFMMVIRDAEGIVAVGCVLTTGHFLSFNSFCQKDERVPNIGAIMLTCIMDMLIALYSACGFIFSPTATTMEGQDEYSVYKHIIGNVEFGAHMLATVRSDSDAREAGWMPPYFALDTNTWIPRDETTDEDEDDSDDE